MAIKCAECGAALKNNSKFCSYCGAKIDDNVKRIEVNVNKRIEDVAEMKRADYETEESKIRQKGMNRDLRSRIVRRWACLIVLAICILMIALPFWITGTGSLVLLSLIGFIGGIPLLVYIIYLLVTGKW